MSTPITREVLELAKRICPMLAGHPPEVQSAALADLVAMWIAGNVIIGDNRETDLLREQMLELHITLVRQLIPVNYDEIIAPALKKMQQ